ncbi:uncharacterized protein LOC107633420 isoform X3 [Arachis ipaensis]|nr:uncharacterized protein LOC107633420 isoform X3 [Arachis ipaensis]XP_025629290.1 uncharacterized protein LOC112722468 isoform X4 [Arachis hypogaea]
MRRIQTRIKILCHQKCCYFIQQRFGDQLMDPNHASILKSSAAPGQPSGKFCTVLLVRCLHKFKVVVSNYQGLLRIKSRQQQFDFEGVATHTVTGEVRSYNLCKR